MLSLECYANLRAVYQNIEGLVFDVFSSFILQVLKNYLQIVTALWIHKIYLYIYGKFYDFSYITAD